MDIDDGTIDNAVIGGTTQAAGSFTTLSASDATTLNGAVTLGDDAADAVTVTGTVQGANPLVFNAGNNNTTFAIDATGTDKTVTFPDASGTVAVTCINSYTEQSLTSFNQALSSMDEGTNF